MEKKNKYYRSGLLLGLTIAETLLLTLFILLLVFSGFLMKGKNEIDRNKKKIEELEKQNSSLSKENKLFSEIKDLIIEKAGENFDDFFAELKKNEEIKSKSKKLESALKEITNKNELLKQEVKRNQKLLKKYYKFVESLKKIYPNSSDENNLMMRAEKKLQQISKIEQSNSKEITDVYKQNEDLKRQIDHLVKIQKGLGKGADYPPCWLDDQNKIEYLFKIILTDTGLIINKIKNDKRDKDMKALPLDNLEYTSILSKEEFLTRLKTLYNHCVQNNCRHFVRIFDQTTTKETFKKHLLTAERYFYKYLVPNNAHEN